MTLRELLVIEGFAIQDALIQELDDELEEVRRKPEHYLVDNIGRKVHGFLGESGGDWEDFRTAFERLVQAVRDGDDERSQDHDLSETPLPRPIDWAGFWADDHHQEWLIEPVLPKGRLISLFAKGKAGKSLLALELAAALATGRPVLGRPASEPIDVVYIDNEMTEADLDDRLSDLGYGPDDDLSHLHYYLLQTLPPLDTKEGGDALFAVAHRDRAQLVIIDTLSRVISGNENDADTFLALYRNTEMRMKAAGITFLRLDHSGKDEKKGQRGSSAKNQDADIVWQLSDEGPRTDGGHRITLKAKASRLQLPSDTIRLERKTEPLRHELVGGKTISHGARDVLEVLDELGLPADAGRKSARAALRKAGKTAANNYLQEALRWRKRRPVTPTVTPPRTVTPTVTPGHPAGKPDETVATVEETAPGHPARSPQNRPDRILSNPIGVAQKKGGSPHRCVTCGNEATAGMIAGKKYCEVHGPDSAIESH